MVNSFQSIPVCDRWMDRQTRCLSLCCTLAKLSVTIIFVDCRSSVFKGHRLFLSPNKQRHSTEINIHSELLFYCTFTKVCTFMKQEDSADSQRPLQGSSSSFGTLSQRGLTPIKLAYDLHWPDGQLR